MAMFMDNGHVEEHHGGLVVACELNGDHRRGHSGGELTLDGIPDRQSVSYSRYRPNGSLHDDTRKEIISVFPTSF